MKKRADNKPIKLERSQGEKSRTGTRYKKESRCPGKGKPVISGFRMRERPSLRIAEATVGRTGSKRELEKGRDVVESAPPCLPCIVASYVVDRRGGWEDRRWEKWDVRGTDSIV